jgi:ubiquinone/menaquinone biosynthesis C-methylase UbiE
MCNRAAGTDASKIIFPYASSSFNLVFLTSVFTHIFDSQIDNHLREIARVLKSGATCLNLKVQNQDILLTQKVSCTPAGDAFADTLVLPRV